MSGGDRRSGALMTPFLPHSLEIVPMMEDKLDEVLFIEQNSFAQPWSKKSFLAELQEHVSHCFVGLIREKIAAYIIFRVILDEAHLMTIATHPEYRSKGLGAAILEYAVRLSRELGAEKMYLEVRRSNIPAKRIYLKAGFSCTGFRKKYYMPEQEDALLMELTLSPVEAGPG
jgi:ribosomal-protein-alanine N-acetyltransferase